MEIESKRLDSSLPLDPSWADPLPQRRNARARRMPHRARERPVTPSAARPPASPIRHAGTTPGQEKEGCQHSVVLYVLKSTLVRTEKQMNKTPNPASPA